MHTEILSTPFGETIIKTIGKTSLENPSILVLHGGPGYTHDYLIEPLLPLSKTHTLIFYDQPTLASTKNQKEKLSPELIYKHFRWLSNHLANNRPLNVIAHSWGCLLFLASQADPNFSNEPSCEFGNCLLINPTPVTSSKYNDCSKNLIKRISKLDQLKLTLWTLTNKKGSKIMKTLLPYYVVDTGNIPTQGLSPDTKTYLTLAKKLKNFDYSQTLPKLPKVKLITGEQDFITLEQIDDLTNIYPNFQIIKTCGHFPFWEQPEKFNKILQNTFLNQCETICE